jgi:hypothetical protein
MRTLKEWRWLVAVVMCGEFALAAPPPMVLTNLSCAGDHASVTLQAWPGDYVVQTSAQLPRVWSNECRVSVGVAGAASATLPIQGRDQLFIRAAGLTPSDGAGCLAQFQTLGSVFQPDVRCDAGSLAEFLWIWSDGTTSSNWPIATKDFGSSGARMQGLKLEPTGAITSINLGFDGADGGWTTPLDTRAGQNVSAVRFPYPLASLRYWASSYCPITNTLDFTGCTALEAIECFNCSPLQHVVVTNLPALTRACFEDCDLRELDLSGNPNLGDLRGAVNAYTNIVVGGGTGPRVWHWCVRDNPQLTQRFADIMTNFYSLRELYIWNDNQHGEFKVGSTNLMDLQAANNHFTSADLAGQSNLWNCSFEGNSLTNVNLAGCSGLRYFDLHRNALTTNALDAILAELDATALGLAQANLSENPQYPSAVGCGHYTNLTARGAQVLLDWPPTNDGSNNVPGGTNAITFVTTSRQPHMEIQTAWGATPSIVWHWGDGTVQTGAKVATHDFGAAGSHLSYVQVTPPGCVTYFGAQSGTTGQGIKSVIGLTNFPNLNFLYLYQESVTELSLAGCSNLVQLHLAANPVPASVCDQWFLDLETAVAGPVAGADFYYPASQRTAASDAAWTNLVNKGYAMHPF